MAIDATLADTRIGVLDDNRNFQNLMRTLLRAMGFRRVDVFAEPDEARDFVLQTPVDLMFVDLIMPRQSGVEWVRSIRRGTRPANPTMPIALVTGWADRRVVEAAVAAGVDDVLVKPLSTVTLHRHTMRLLSQPARYVRGAGGYFGPNIELRSLRERNARGTFGLAGDSSAAAGPARRRLRSLPGLHVEIRDTSRYDGERTFLD